MKWPFVAKLLVRALPPVVLALGLPAWMRDHPYANCEVIP